MLGLGLGVTFGQVFLTDINIRQEAQAVIDAMTTAPSATRVGIINALVAALQDAGVWTKLGNLYVLAAHDAQAARINWVAPGTADLAEVGSPTFTADQGYAGDNATSYLTSGAAIRAPYELNSAHLGVWINDNQAGSNGVIGVASATVAPARLNPRTAGNVISSRINSSSNTTVGSITDSSGHTVLVRTAAAVTAIYKNGASVKSGTEVSSAVPTDHLTVLRADITYSPHQVSIAHAGSGLTAGEVGAMEDAFAAYRTAVGL